VLVSIYRLHGRLHRGAAGPGGADDILQVADAAAVAEGHRPCHSWVMSSPDRWSEKLRCPLCGARGEARLSEYAGHRIMSDYGTAVDALPKGFREVKNQRSKVGNVDIVCAKCEVSCL
jgi:hypothetical protein